MLQWIEGFNETMIPVVDKILKIGVTAIVSTVSGIFAALIVLVLIFLMGFIYVTIMEQCFGNTSKFCRFSNI